MVIISRQTSDVKCLCVVQKSIPLRRSHATLDVSARSELDYRIIIIISRLFMHAVFGRSTSCCLCADEYRIVSSDFNFHLEVDKENPDIRHLSRSPRLTATISVCHRFAAFMCMTWLACPAKPSVPRALRGRMRRLWARGVQIEAVSRQAYISRQMVWHSASPGFSRPVSPSSA